MVWGSLTMRAQDDAEIRTLTNCSSPAASHRARTTSLPLETGAIMTRTGLEWIF